MFLLFSMALLLTFLMKHKAGRAYMCTIKMCSFFPHLECIASLLVEGSFNHLGKAILLENQQQQHHIHSHTQRHTQDLFILPKGKHIHQMTAGYFFC